MSIEPSPFEIMLENIESGKYVNVSHPYPESSVPSGEKRNKLTRAYRDENHRLDELFKSDLLQAYGLQNHPKVEKLYNFVESNRHSEGLRAMLDEFDELSEFLQP